MNDRYAWALETARAVRAGNIARIDSETLARELEEMSRSDRRELRNLARRVIEHRVKIDYIGGLDAPHWRGELVEFIAQLADLIDESPSLLDELNTELVQRAYWSTIKRLKAQYGALLIEGAPSVCPYARGDLFDS